MDIRARHGRGTGTVSPPTPEPCLPRHHVVASCCARLRSREWVSDSLTCQSALSRISTTMAGQVAPLVVQVLPGNGADSPVALPANNPLVLASPALKWNAAPAGPGGVARVSLSQSSMIRCFGRRCGAAPAVADQAFARTNVTPLNMGLSGPCWARVLGELLASGILAAGIDGLPELDKSLDGLTLANPASLHIAVADWALGEAHTAVAAVAPVAAIPGRPAVLPQRAVAGRRGRAAVPAVAGVAAVAPVPAVPGVPGRLALNASLEFLSLVNPLDFEEAELLAGSAS